MLAPTATTVLRNYIDCGGILLDYSILFERGVEEVALSHTIASRCSRDKIHDKSRFYLLLYLEHYNFVRFTRCCHTRVTVIYTI